MQFRDSLSATTGRLRGEAGDLTGVLLDPNLWLDVGARALRVAVVIALALATLALLRRLRMRAVKRVKDLPANDPRRQRTLTLSGLFGSTSRYVVWGIATVMALAETGLSIGPLIAGAGVAGLAIGFGAQTLVKDVISGVFLLFDQTIRVGDLITFGGEAGTVEYIGLRLIKMRKFDGELVMIPAGELRTFGNKSVGFARVIVEVALSYEAEVDEVLAALDEVATEWASDEANRAIMLEEHPEVQAIMALGDSAVTARIVVQVIPGEQFQAERALRRLIKVRFDERGVEIPFPRRTVYVRREGGADEAAPEVEAGAGGA
jgi:small conductance mechanosensitive channel